MENKETRSMYEQLGISAEVWAYGQKTEESLKERFRQFDETAEYNQLKVIKAMQENRVSEGCFNYVSGYDISYRGGACASADHMRNPRTCYCSGCEPASGR